MRLIVTAAFLLIGPSVAVAQQPPAGGWPAPLPITAGPPPVPPVPDGVPVRVIEVVDLPPQLPDGQQHWASVNLIGGQPSAVRVGVRVWPRANNSVWLEAYSGSALFDAMYGFGVRVQHTAWTFGNGDSVLISPGLGVHILPDWYASDPTLHYSHRRGYWTSSYGHWSSLTYLAGDVDISWLHDFSPHFGFELGAKVGLAGRLSGDVGDCYPRNLMWGRNLYPILAVYTGLRF